MNLNLTLCKSRKENVDNFRLLFVIVVRNWINPLDIICNFQEYFVIIVIHLKQKSCSTTYFVLKHCNFFFYLSFLARFIISQTYFFIFLRHISLPFPEPQNSVPAVARVPQVKKQCFKK